MDMGFDAHFATPQTDIKRGGAYALGSYYFTRTSHCVKEEAEENKQPKPCANKA